MDPTTRRDNQTFDIRDSVLVNIANPAIKKYFSQAEQSADEGDWLSRPEIPSSEEIIGAESSDDDCVELAPNKVTGPWLSKDLYLKSHYELLREDAVAPLRDAVAYVREDPQMMDSQTVAIYEKVHIVGITFAQKGLAFRIQFSTNRSGKNIVWEYSKRLMSGTIVALSPVQDYFRRECIVAVVAARPLEGVKMQPAEVDLYFSRSEDVHFDPQQEWVMVESRSGYYESARHTMTALQRMAREEFPLQNHICHLDPTIDAPEYIKENPVVDIRPAFGNLDNGKINLLKSWPKRPLSDHLDASQWSALECILTKKLAIIQGPPGTGKTHVSVIALKIMLSNAQPDDPPIIIAAQTNHALDQLLTHVSSFEKNYIRLGARSTDVEIRKRTLFAVRQREPVENLHGGLFSPARKSFGRIVASIVRHLKAFSKANGDAPLPASFFLDHGLLTQTQYDSLESGSKSWRRPGCDEEVDPLIAWLGDEVVKYEVNYTTENFGFVEDEVDLEYEQLKEFEAEQGLDDDDQEALKGQYMGLKEGFRGRNAISCSEKAISEYLRRRDMWKIPSKVRGAVYNKLRQLAKVEILHDFRRLVELYNLNCRDLQIGKWERDYTILRGAKVVGMTTTGLTKYRALVSSLRPKIIMIEEAAEVIEAPVATSCVESLQHLILVGDHKQLRGHCTVQELAGDPFFLDMSMFERLVNNGISYMTLTRQRRMAPEIRRLLTPIYGDELQDHPSVENRPGVPGMGDIACFFFSHKWLESTDSLASKFNEMEANMIVGFFLHLVLNGVAVTDITVLTFYNGQRKRLLRLLKNHPYLQGTYVKVVTVDSYQGEENEVIILSLVRSSSHDRIGFLSVENRVCVALSRAKRGLFIFGNARSLASADRLWWEIIHMMGNDEAEKRRLGFHLPLQCSRHKNKTFIREPTQWTGINGGCRIVCNENLSCGHKCSLRCHSFTHDRVSCSEICGKKNPCGHKCMQPCSNGHICNCKCAAGNQIAASNLSFGFGATDNEEMTAEEERRALAKSYQDFANGGARKQDFLLLAKARGQLQEGLDRMALTDLLEDHSSMESETMPGSSTTAAAAAPSQVDANVGDVYAGDYLDRLG